MKSSNKTGSTELLIILLFWALLFASPLLFGKFEEGIQWRPIFHIWLNYIPLIVLFLINRFILLPKFYFRNKRKLFFISAGGLIILFTFLSFLYNKNAKQPHHQSPRFQELTHHETIENPPPFGENKFPPPRGDERQNPIPPSANLFILSILIIGFDTGLRMSIKWTQMEKEKTELQKENIENQLAFLRNQISPHFFMNTLNNIHALIDFDSNQAKNSVIKLSKLMRYLLSESQEGTTTIKNEFDFLEAYIDLMKLRVSERVKIEVNLNVNETEKKIPPLLFVSLVENAFKYGVSYSKKSFISIKSEIISDYLYFVIKNSKFEDKSTSKNTKIGLENLKKQLSLLYGKNYKLKILETENEFSVNLKIPIYHD